jgi:hypothetical protein
MIVSLCASMLCCTHTLQGDEDDYEEDFYADDDADNDSQQQDDVTAATNDTATADDTANEDANGDSGDAVAEDGHFMHAIAQMGFSDVETAALRLCVARSDPMVR